MMKAFSDDRAVENMKTSIAKANSSSMWRRNKLSDFRSTEKCFVPFTLPREARLFEKAGLLRGWVVFLNGEASLECPAQWLAIG